MHDMIKYFGAYAYRIELYTEYQQPDKETFAQTSITKVKKINVLSQYSLYIHVL